LYYNLQREILKPFICLGMSENNFFEKAVVDPDPLLMKEPKA
jgi:hypothetical protein